MYSPSCKFVSTLKGNLIKVTENLENEIVKTANENDILDGKSIIYHEFGKRNQTANGRFYKEVMIRLIARLQRVRRD